VPVRHKTRYAVDRSLQVSKMGEPSEFGCSLRTKSNTCSAKKTLPIRRTRGEFLQPSKHSAYITESAHVHIVASWGNQNIIFKNSINKVT